MTRLNFNTVDEFCKQLRYQKTAWFAEQYEDSVFKHIVCIKDNDPTISERKYISWCDENCSGKFDVFNENIVLFELAEDAMAFKLMWDK